MKFRETTIPGCFEISPNLIKDSRGVFVKTIYEPIFKEKGLETSFVEQFYSVSNQNVLRGLHFQKPPMEQTKVVYCIAGKIFDVVVDLRVGSRTFGRYEIFNLCSNKGNMVYIPAGLAHGFFVLSEQAIVVYNCSNIFSASHDGGIHWNSLNISWPTNSPILSTKDKMLIPFIDFNSPFYFRKEDG